MYDVFRNFLGHHRVPHPQINLVAYKHHAPPILFHGEIRHQTTHIKNKGQPSSVPIDTNIVDTFSPPLSLPTKTLAPPHRQHPCERNSDGGSAEFGHRVQRCPSKQQIDRCQSPPNGLPAPCRPCSDCLPRRRRGSRATGF